MSRVTLVVNACLLVETTDVACAGLLIGPIKTCIFGRSKKADNDAIVNVMGSPKIFEPISKNVSFAISLDPNKMFGSIIIK